MNAFDLQLRAALVGDFDKEVGQGKARFAAARMMALADYGAEIQTRWRYDVQQSGLQNAGRMGNTIRLKRYANGGKNPAILVYSSFPVLQAAFEQAITISSPRGKWLLMPNPDVWPGGRIRRPRGQQDNGDKSISLQTAIARFGELHLIRRPGKAAILVAQVRASSTGAGFRKASATTLRTGRGLTSIVVFWVVRKSRTPRLLHGSVIRDRARRDAAPRIQALTLRRLAELENQAQLGGPSNVGRFFLDDSGNVREAPATLPSSGGFG